MVVGGFFTNLFEKKYARQIGSWTPQGFGGKNKTSLKPPPSNIDDQSIIPIAGRTFGSTG